MHAPAKLVLLEYAEEILDRTERITNQDLIYETELLRATIIKLIIELVFIETFSAVNLRSVHFCTAH